MNFLAHANSDFKSSDIFLGYFTNNENFEKLRSIIEEISWEIFTPIDRKVFESTENFNENMNIFDKNKKYIFFTDFHDKTYYLFKYFKKYLDLKLLVLDAHPDCYNDGKSTNYQNFIFHMIKDEILKPDDILLIGIRNYSKKELEFMESYGIKFMESYDFFDDFNHCLNKIIEFATGNNIYISVDLDVLSTEHTNWTEPYGLGEREILKILKNINKFIFVIDFTEGKLSKKDKFIWKISYYIFLRLWC